MGYLTDLFQHLAKRKAAISELAAPWKAERISIYGFLQQHLAEQINPRSFGDIALPDEEQFYQGEAVRWAPGARDGAFGHHGSPGDDEGAGQLFRALKRVSAFPTSENFATLYTRMMQHGALEAADKLFALLHGSRAIDLGRVSALAARIAREGPDREPVKLAIVLLGILSDSTQRDVIFTLGQHDEFTLYAAVALARIVPDSDREAIWWALAKKVRGWGRIHIVERLAETANSDIRAWLLREGYRNGIMNEYLAYACAKNGNLVSALRRSPIDAALLRGAGNILEALANGGPAEDMTDYDEGVEACLLYVKHVLEMPSADVEHCLPLRAIKMFTEDKERDWNTLTQYGWTIAARQEISVSVDQILARPEWIACIKQALSDEDERRFGTAALAASLFGIDAWTYHFERQKAGKSNSWHALMATDDPGRMDRVLDLALTQFDLASLASGPALELGSRPEFRQHGELDFILQGLDAFPGKGWPFIKAGLQSPVMSNRWKALSVLSAWGRSQWPEECELALFRAQSREPDEDIKKNIKRVLDGRPLE